jgi:hypothetical protein
MVVLNQVQYLNNTHPVETSLEPVLMLINDGAWRKFAGAQGMNPNTWPTSNEML